MARTRGSPQPTTLVERATRALQRGPNGYAYAREALEGLYSAGLALDPEQSLQALQGLLMLSQTLGEQFSSRQAAQQLLDEVVAPLGEALARHAGAAGALRERLEVAERATKVARARLTDPTGAAAALPRAEAGLGVGLRPGGKKRSSKP